MMIRTIETTVTFSRPFLMPSLPGHQPAGTYRLVMDDLEIGLDGLGNADGSGNVFINRKRLATQLHVPALSMFKIARKIVDISDAELTMAIEADSRPEFVLSHRDCGATR